MPKRKNSLKAVILVGGQGTRLRPLTFDIPKSMVPVLNKPFMEYTIAYLKKFEVKDIILTLNYLPEVFQDYFGDGSRFGVRLTYCLEESPLGTAGAVKNAEKYLNSTFLVLNGDVFTDLDIADMLAFHRSKGAVATISLKRVDDPSAFGVVETDADSRVKQFIEKPPPRQAITNWINAGTYILEPKVLQYVPLNSHYTFEKGLFPLLLQRGESVYGYPFSGYWLDMGNPGKYLSLNCDLLKSKTCNPISDNFKDGISCAQDVAIHPSVRITPPAIIGRGCRIGAGVDIKGPVVIGTDCRLEQDARIENAVLWHHVHIGYNARISRCIIGTKTSVEPDNQVSNKVIISSHIEPLIQEP